MALFVCHCNECRRQSASAFGMSYLAPRDDLRLLQGSPKNWQRQADSGNTVNCFFCPVCGTLLWHENSGSPETVTVKAGSLDEPVDFADAIHIWVSRKLPGVDVPQGAAQFLEEPT
ncbi:GFA family protein [Nitratireductor mangrovi]|uniref:GFA family protein n=1 Tax=Nitratireductor mangrovi TaxID=2599600 RepID=A0A5B8KXR6_9HYPH|nr:GFA family protein [Nitratireductor mangrovi]